MNDVLAQTQTHTDTYRLTHKHTQTHIHKSSQSQVKDIFFDTARYSIISVYVVSKGAETNSGEFMGSIALSENYITYTHIYICI